jgi:hypothetical protein
VHAVDEFSDEFVHRHEAFDTVHVGSAEDEAMVHITRERFGEPFGDAEPCLVSPARVDAVEWAVNAILVL